MAYQDLFKIAVCHTHLNLRDITQHAWIQVYNPTSLFLSHFLFPSSIHQDAPSTLRLPPLPSFTLFHQSLRSSLSFLAKDPSTSSIRGLTSTTPIHSFRSLASVLLDPLIPPAFQNFPFLPDQECFSQPSLALSQDPSNSYGVGARYGQRWFTAFTLSLRFSSAISYHRSYPSLHLFQAKRPSTKPDWPYVFSPLKGLNNQEWKTCEAYRDRKSDREREQRKQERPKELFCTYQNSVSTYLGKRFDKQGLIHHTKNGHQPKEQYCEKPGCLRKEPYPTILRVWLITWANNMAICGHPAASMDASGKMLAINTTSWFMRLLFSQNW